MKFDLLFDLIMENNKKPKYQGKFVSFKSLPYKKSYGYTVFPDGSFDIANAMEDHVKSFQRAGYKDYEDFYKAGGVRVGWDKYNPTPKYYLEFTKPTRNALNVAKDIVKFYNKEYELNDQSYIYNK